MAEYGILFSAPMVRAILAGRKTQTLRLLAVRWNNLAKLDRLWVREPFAPSVSHPDAMTMPEYDGGHNPAHLYYRADVRKGLIDGCDEDRVKRKPAIFMPRWASRISLVVDDVRVESLWVISEHDARAEGFPDRHTFAQLWDVINGKRAPWASNPHVLVITFAVSQ